MPATFEYTFDTTPNTPFPLFMGWGLFADLHARSDVVWSSDSYVYVTKILVGRFILNYPRTTMTIKKQQLVEQLSGILTNISDTAREIEIITQSIEREKARLVQLRIELCHHLNTKDSVETELYSDS